MGKRQQESAGNMQDERARDAAQVSPMELPGCEDGASVLRSAA